MADEIALFERLMHHVKELIDYYVCVRRLVPVSNRRKTH